SRHMMSVVRGRGRVELGELFVRERHSSAGDILLKVSNAASAGDRQHHGAALQHPGQRNLAARCALGLGKRVDHAARLREIARRERKPGDKADPVRLAIVEYGLVSSVSKGVAILHRRYREDLAGRLDLRDRHLAEARMADEALVDKFADSAELL